MILDDALIIATNPLIQSLSAFLNDLPIHPPAQRSDAKEFRDPDGVRGRIGYFHRMSKGQVYDDRRLQTAIWEKYNNDQKALEDAVQGILKKYQSQSGTYIDARNLARLQKPTADREELEHKVSKLLNQETISLPKGNANPERRAVSREEYIRCPQVIATVLGRAKGKCELCRESAPFDRADGTPYLEVHHVIPLSEIGPDSVENAVALCPNCHRRCHHSKDKDETANQLKEMMMNSV